ncbi:hypothetical protein sos41_29940 [Alphaproteobacteria bacterium SO-S41]|nr:hypothetical protein sos41_29940 [Alphaproteobacteria bacterium SO-S41]
MKTTLACLAAAAALVATADAKPQPVWEIGLGAFATYSPAYYGSSESTFGGFPVVYFSYRGEDFSILSNGLYDVAASSEKRFDFGLSVDIGGNVDSEDRLFLGDIDYVGEVGPKITVALFANGTSRFEVGVAARAAFELGEGYIGYVIQPEVAYLTTLSSTTRLGISVAPKFGFDGYNERFYATPFFAADSGYIGTDISLKLVNDVSDRFRISGEVKAISLSGAENEDSPLYQEDWNYAVRIGFTYAIYQSEAMTSD